MNDPVKQSGVSADQRFVEYYAEQSLSDAALERFSGIKDAVLRLRAAKGLTTDGLRVADIGCNTGTQCRLWARDGHRVQGIDIGNELIDLAAERAAEENLEIEFFKGSATDLPWEDKTFDICLLPELLEHVEDWESCLNEACRVVRPGGVLYLSTTNLLCPVQQEFNLPGYSWYPGFLKRYYEKVSVSTKPELVNFATFPAVHWFTFYQLRRFISRHGMESLDRFDMIDTSNRGLLAKAVVGLLTKVPPIAVLGHVATPYTVVFAYRPEVDEQERS